MKTLHVMNREEWRSWLEEHHATEREVWLLFYKRHTGKPRIPYEDAVEEAVCFGWIESIMKRVDDETYVQKFTPRKEKSTWSEVNRKRAKKMIEEGKMTEAGLEKLGKVDVKDVPAPQKKELVVPLYVKEAFVAHGVWEHFCNLAISYRRQYVGWIDSAKKEETQERRIAEAVELLREGKRLPLK